MIQDYKLAVQWYTKSATQGEAVAQCSLSLIYSRGEGIPQDYAEAYAWALLAEMHGDSETKDRLAKELTPDQITKGQARAKEIQKKMKKPSSTAN